MNQPSHVDVRVSRRFDAAAEKVFDAWLDPEVIGKWTKMLNALAETFKIME